MARQHSRTADGQPADRTWPRYAYPMLCDLVLPWVIPVTFLAMNGLPFDRTFPKPTPAWHRECWLSRAGKLILAAQAGAVAPVPAGIINGTWWRGAAQPPLDPPRVIAALGQLIEHLGCRMASYCRSSGRPVSLAGSELSGQGSAPHRSTMMRADQQLCLSVVTARMRKVGETRSELARPLNESQPPAMR